MVCSLQQTHVSNIAMGVGTGGGAQGARPPPPIILPSEIFLTQYALLSRKFSHKMLIFNKNFPARFARHSR